MVEDVCRAVERWRKRNEPVQPALPAHDVADINPTVIKGGRTLSSESSMKALFKRAVPYADDALNLPVADVASAIPYYEQTFGFRVVSRQESPHARAILSRDDIQIGLAENGGDPTQEGCFFEVDDVEAAYAEINGKPPEPAAIETQRMNGRSYRAFFVVAPDGLCYLVAQPVV